MPGDPKDPVADFFGEDDVEWLDDESEVVERKGPQKGPPKAPPPPPPFGASPSILPKDSKRAERDRLIQPRGELSKADTVVFSQVPTLVESDLDEPGIGDLDTVEVDRDGPSMFGDDDQPTTRVAPEERRAAMASTPAPAPMAEAPTAVPPDTFVEHGDMVGDAVVEEAADTPMVRTQDPAPIRMFLPQQEDVGGPTLAPFSGAVDDGPDGDQNHWRMVTATLITEASVAPPDERGELLFRAGWIFRDRLEDPTGAYALYKDALRTTCRNPELYEAFAGVCGELEVWREAAETLHERAALLDGVRAAESLRRAAQIHFRQAGEDREGINRLWDSLEANPDDYASLTLLREHLPPSAPRRAEVLARLARLTDGVDAAELWASAGREREPSDPDLAIQDYQAALRARPGHVRAFVGLQALLDRAGDHDALARLYAEQAVAWPEESAWWSFLEARSRADAGEPMLARAAYEAAASAGMPYAAQECRAMLHRAEAWGALAELEKVRAETLEGRAAAAAWFRVGWLHERHGDDPVQAAEAYRRAVAADATAFPAREGLDRMVSRSPEADVQLGHLRARLEASAPESRGEVHLQLAEAAEDHGRFDLAREHFEACLALEPARPTAWAGLCRATLQLGDASGVSAAYSARAQRAERPEVRGQLVACAALLPGFSVRENSFSLLQDILTDLPGHLPALEAMGLACQTVEQWGFWADALVAATGVLDDSVLQGVLHYQAGRVRMLHLDDADGARRSFAASMARLPGGGTVERRDRDAATGSGNVGAITSAYRELAESSSDPQERAWALFAAGVLSDPRLPAGRTDLEAVLAHVPGHGGASSLLAEVVIAAGPASAVLPLHEGRATRGSSALDALLVAHTLVVCGRPDDAERWLMAVAGAGGPVRAAIMVARQSGSRTAELELLAALPGTSNLLERARLLAENRSDRDAARKLVADVVSMDSRSIEAALTTTHLGRVGADSALLQLGQGAVARFGTSVSMRVANAMWAADRAEHRAQFEGALELYELAHQLEPNSEAAVQGRVRCLYALERPEALLELARTLPLDPLRMARHLEVLGEIDGSAGLLTTASRLDPALPALLHLEIVLEQKGDWQGVVATLEKRSRVSRDEAQRDAIARRRRWVLAEKLTASDDAWNTFQALHDDDPSDRDVLETLARIAGARKLTERAIGYLDELAKGSSELAESARYKRRIAEVYLAADNTASARQAYLDALDYLPADKLAVEGLEAIASAGEDWAQLVEVLGRKATLAQTDDERMVIQSRIAMLYEEQLGQPRVAIEAWRTALDTDPQNIVALDRLLELCEQEEAWISYVDFAKVRSALATGRLRTQLLGRIGAVTLDHLKSDEGIRYLELATTEDPPDAASAVRIEEHYRKRSDWKGVARALEVQSRAEVDLEARCAALEKAANLEIDQRHDRDAAATVYNRLLVLDPDHEDALRFMATHLFETGRFDEAMPVCERLEPMVERGQDLDDFDTRMELAQFYFYYAEMLRLAGEEGAMHRYMRALDLNNTHLASLEAVGPLLCEAGEWKRAESVYKQLLQLSGGLGERHKVATTYTQLGLVERALGEGEKARKRFAKALDYYPNHVDALKGMALVLEDQEDWSNLLNIYNNVIYHASVVDDVIAGYMTKGRILDQHLGRPDKAAQHYNRSVEFKAEQPRALLRLAELSMRKSEHEAAGEFARRALKLEEPDLEPIRDLLVLVVAVAKAAAGKRDEAMALYGPLTTALTGLPERGLDDLEALRLYVHARLPPTR